jgi:hypothetical protein
MSAAIVPFNFRGDSLDVVRLPDGDVGVSLRRLCETVGIDPEGQRQRLARLAASGARWAVACMTQATGSDGKTYSMLALPRRSIPMWAATVDASRCAPHVRPKLIAYQDEAADVLAAAFLGPSALPQPSVAAELADLRDRIEGLEVSQGGTRSDLTDLAKYVHQLVRAGTLPPQAAPSPDAPRLPSARDKARFPHVVAFLDRVVQPGAIHSSLNLYKAYLHEPQRDFITHVMFGRIAGRCPFLVRRLWEGAVSYYRAPPDPMKPDPLLARA